jgi:prolipoprotein diacylglyceryltransferase
MPWGVVFPPGSIAGFEFPDTPIHPVMLYEMAINLGIFGLLWGLRKRPSRDGFLFCLYAMLYSVGRFWVSGFRADSLMLPLGSLGSFRIARVISVLIFLAAGTLIMIKRLWEKENHADS